MHFDTFKQEAERSGLIATKKGYQWMLRGGTYSVNYYPTKDRAYINGMAKGFRCDAAEAILLATEGPPDIGKRAERKGSNRRHKWAMLRRSNLCHWCKCVLTIHTATIDHVIPIGRGGADQRDNMVLACEPCNKKRGCTLGPPQ
jgi:hypothetical protein